MTNTEKVAEFIHSLKQLMPVGTICREDETCVRIRLSANRGRMMEQAVSINEIEQTTLTMGELAQHIETLIMVKAMPTVRGN